MKNEEIWKDIENYIGVYQVSNFGLIRKYTLNGYKILHQSKVGYSRIGLRKDGKAISFSVHRLVATAFLLNPENKPCVNHIDGNKSNNHVSNLEWCTYSENTQHAIKNGLTNVLNGSSGKHGNQKLTEQDVLNILKDNRTQTEIARCYNVSIANISLIKLKKAWKHLSLETELLNKIEKE